MSSAQHVAIGQFKIETQKLSQWQDNPCKWIVSFCLSDVE